MTTHAKLSPSSSARWLTCTGSVKAEQNIPNTSSIYAAEGTSAHALAELCLTDNKNPYDFIGQTIEGFTVDEDMADNISAYIAYVRSFSGHHFYEQSVSFNSYIPNGYGTADAIVIDENTNTIHVIDLKYGKGTPVDATENTQGMLYALGAYIEYDFIYDIKNVVIHIYQPRIKNYSSWSISITDLITWAEWAKQRANEALSDNAPRTPSEKACQFCRAKATCKALLEHTHNVLMNDFEDLSTVNPDTLNDDELKVILDNAKLIKSWLDAVETHVYDRMLAGGTFNGYKLVNGRSSRAWRDESQTIAELSQRLPSEKLYTQKLITPAQAEKLIKDKSLLESLIIKNEGKPTLTQDCDKRIALNDANVFDVLD